MRLNITYLGVFLISCFFGIAQKIDFGKSFETEYQGYEPTILFEDEKYLYGVDYNSPDIILQVFDKRKKSTKKHHVIPIPELKKVRESISRFGFIGNKLVLFMEMDYYRENRSKLVAYTIDPERGRIDNEIILMDKAYENSRYIGYYEVKISRDHQSAVINSATYYPERAITEQIIVLLDDELKEAAKRKFSLSGKGVEVRSNMLIDNDGAIYMLANGELIMYDPFNDFEEWREAIPINDLAVNGTLYNLGLSVRPDGNLVLSAFYFTVDTEDQPDANLPRRDRKEGDTQIEGVKFMVFDPINREFIAEKLNMFDQNFIDDFRNDDDKHDGHDGEINQNFNDLKFHFDEQGNCYLIAQPIWYERSYDRNGKLNGEFYHYEELMVLAFDANANLAWEERIPKRQMYYWGASMILNIGSHGTALITVPFNIPGFFDYYSYVKDGKLFVFYNDMLLNRAGKSQDQELETYRKIKKGNPVVQEINLANGERKGSVVPNLARPKMYLKPGLMHYSAKDDTFYYFLVYKKMMQLNSFKL
ncbi:MAG: hypothetical protein ACPGVV_04750 [Croceimicrobium sp.]